MIQLLISFCLTRSSITKCLHFTCGLANSCVLNSSKTKPKPKPKRMQTFSIFRTAPALPQYKQIPFGAARGTSSGNQLFVYIVRVLFLARFELDGKGRIGSAGRANLDASEFFVFAVSMNFWHFSTICWLQSIQSFGMDSIRMRI